MTDAEAQCATAPGRGGLTSRIACLVAVLPLPAAAGAAAR